MESSPVHSRKLPDPSITEFSVNYKINPATALKGINLLVDENIIFKKRGVGMFVSNGAVKAVKRKAAESILQQLHQ